MAGNTKQKKTKSLTSLVLFNLQTEPLKLYYVMYNTSKPSSTKSGCNVGIVSHQEIWPMRENVDTTDALAEGQPAEQSVDVSCHTVDDGNVAISASVSDAADINSNVGSQTTTRPVCCSGLYMEKFGTEETSRAVAGVNGNALECGTVEQAASTEMLDFTSFALSAPDSELLDASHKDNTVGSVTNDDYNESVLPHDDLSQNDAAVSPQLTSAEKIGFEPDAITATDQWPPPLPVVERKVRRLQTEVQRLLFDEKRELRTSGRCIGGVRRKTQRSPLLRLRTIVNVRPSSSSRHHNRLNGKVNSKRNK